MPAENLRRLIERTGSSVQQLTAVAGVPENRLAHWIKPGTVLSRMPTMIQIHEIAQILGCTPQEVYHAFRTDVDGAAAVLDGDLPADERELLAAYRRLDEGDRRKVLQIVHVFTGK